MAGDQEYLEALRGTVGEAKAAIQEMDNPDYARLLELEETGNDRKTLKSFLEEKVEHQDTEKAEGSSSEPSRGITISINQAIVGVFVLGLLTGFVGGIVAPVQVGTGVGQANAIAPSGDNGDVNPSGGTNADGIVELSKTEFPYETDYGTGSGSVTYGSQTFSLEGEPYIGSPSAEVKVISFEDFECPFCSRYNNGAFPKIVENHVKTGEVQYFFKQYPLPSLHPWAQKAAIASECAMNQDAGVFWTFKHGFFNNQNALKKAHQSGNFDSSMYRWAEQTGLDTDQFKQCYDNRETESEVEEDKSEPGRLGTPTIFVGGEKIEGAQPYGNFESAIESKLN